MGILFTSGFTSYLLRHYDLLDNSKDLIQKPFTTGELITKINDSLKKKQQRRDNQDFFYHKRKLTYSDQNLRRFIRKQNNSLL